MDEREAANRAAAEHVVRLRSKLSAGKDEIQRQRASLSDTRDHLSGMQRWIERTEAQLGEERARRGDDDYDDAA
jgi:chromosome segregation ATPase